MKILNLTALTLIAASGLVQAATLTPLSNDSLQWTDASTLPPGAKVAILSGNPKKHETFVARVKFPANYSLPVHMHPVNEYDTVISGELYLGIGSTVDLNKGTALPTGSFVKIPAKTKHYVWTKEETVVQVTGVGPWGMIYQKSK